MLDSWCSYNGTVNLQISKLRLNFAQISVIEVNL